MLNHKFHILCGGFNQWAAVSLSPPSYDHPFDLEIHERWWPWNQEIRNWCASAVPVQVWPLVCLLPATEAWRSGQQSARTGKLSEPWDVGERESGLSSVALPQTSEWPRNESPKFFLVLFHLQNANTCAMYLIKKLRHVETFWEM